MTWDYCRYCGLPTLSDTLECEDCATDIPPALGELRDRVATWTLYVDSNSHWHHVEDVETGWRL